MLFYPKMYRKSIFEISYDKLKKKKIKVLLFDLDNTIGKLNEGKASAEVQKLFKKLSNEFKIAIVSNNSSKKRVSAFAQELNVDYFYFAKKPSTKCVRKAMKKYEVEPENIAMIGDQLVTDILAANRIKCFSILVDPLADKDLKITYLNRAIENRIVKRYNKKGIFTRGEYYE